MPSLVSNAAGNSIDATYNRLADRLTWWMAEASHNNGLVCGILVYLGSGTTCCICLSSFSNPENILSTSLYCPPTDAPAASMYSD